MSTAEHRLSILPTVSGAVRRLFSPVAMWLYSSTNVNPCLAHSTAEQGNCFSLQIWQAADPDVSCPAHVKHTKSHSFKIYKTGFKIPRNLKINALQMPFILVSLFSATSESITKDKSHFAPFLFVYKCTKVNQKMKTEIVMWASLFSRRCFTEINHTIGHRRKSLELMKPCLIKPRPVFVQRWWNSSWVQYSPKPRGRCKVPSCI